MQPCCSPPPVCLMLTAGICGDAWHSALCPRNVTAQVTPQWGMMHRMNLWESSKCVNSVERSVSQSEKFSPQLSDSSNKATSNNLSTSCPVRLIVSASVSLQSATGPTCRCSVSQLKHLFNSMPCLPRETLSPCPVGSRLGPLSASRSLSYY